MIALVGGGESGIHIGVCHPVEVAAVDDRAAYADGMAVHVLCGRMCDDVSAELNRAAIRGSREGVVDDKRNSVGMRKTRELLDVENGNGGIGDGLAEQRPCIGTERLCKLLLGQILIDKGDVDAHLLHRYAEKIVGAAVNRRGSDDVAACLADVEEREEVCRLSARGEHRCDAALKRGELRGYHVVGGVLKSGVEITARF